MVESVIDCINTKKVVTLKLYINGKWIEGESKKEIVDINPANLETIARGYGATKTQALKAIDSAYEAFPKWKKVPPPTRARYVLKFLEIASKKVDELAKLMTIEEGKIISEARGEIIKGLNLVEWYAGEGLRLNGYTAPSELADNILYTIREPVGVVSAITPWNFPWAIPIWKIMPALVAGCTVVFKPASLTPLLAMEFIRIFEEAGLPEGVLNLVIGSGSEVGDVLIEDERIKAVTFTGSNEVGTNVFQKAGYRGIKCVCEMGGKNPCVVWEDADIDIAVGGVVLGAFGSTGQRCTATSRLLLHEAIYDEFMSKLINKVKDIKVGDGLDPLTGMGPAVDEAQFKTDLEYIEIGKKEGRLVYGGRNLQGVVGKGYFVEPTIIEDIKEHHRLFQEEVFGPILAVTKVSDFDEAIRLSNAVRYGLTSAIYSKNIAVCMKYVDEVEAGMVHINSPTIGGEAQIPFGGIKASGIGEKEMAKEGINFFTRIKTVFLDYSGSVRKVKIY
ncbi:MAG: aldehyde dehydrogenase family protein [bacterium]|nr:aldehyde dehydrogenase family protein [bacterium]